MKKKKAKTQAKRLDKKRISTVNKVVPPGGRKAVAFERVTSGIEGLDDILCGGFLKGGTYLILGAPGTGKTILANQISFHQMQKNRKAVYVTLLAESHTRMFGNLRPFDFFDGGKISSEIQYMSGYSVLEKEGLDGLLRLLRELVYQHDASVLFIDGVASADALAGSKEQFKKFVHHLNSVLGIAGCTTFLLSSAEGDQTKPEYTMVDGIVTMTFFRKDLHTARQIEVRKFRGSSHLTGRHFFEITAKGISVYPRIETLLYADHSPRPIEKARLEFGMKELDTMLDGGLTSGSVTTMLGAVGTGKTQIGMEFLRHGASKGEPSVLLSFYENPERLEEKLRHMGRSIESYVKNGTLSIMRCDSGCRLIDKILGRVLKELRNGKTKRLFIDGANGLRNNMFEGERMEEVITAFAHELRALGITTLITEEADNLRPDQTGVLSNDSAISDNVFEFRHAEIDGCRCQTLNILKVRESNHDTSIRLVEFTRKGIRIGGAVEYQTPYLPVVKRRMS